MRTGNSIYGCDMGHYIYNSYRIEIQLFMFSGANDYKNCVVYTYAYVHNAVNSLLAVVAL